MMLSELPAEPVYH